MSILINPDNPQEITPELRELLKRNYFFVNKAQFPSYFAASAIMAYVLIGLALFFALYFKPVFITFLICAILVIFAFVYTIRWYKPYYDQKIKYSQRPHHNLIEHWLVEDILKIVKPHAIEMLSLNPATITPENFIIVPYPIYWETQDIEPNNISRIKNGEYYNYATNIVQIIALSENYISYYNCKFDWMNNKIVSPYTLEFFFQDISSIRVESQNLNLNRKDMPKTEENKDEDTSVGPAQVVVIKNKSQETIDVIVNFPKLESCPKITLKTEKVMQTLRIMLRHRRFGEEYEIMKP